MKLRSYDFRDPAELIEQVHAREPLQAGDAMLVLVKNPSSEQQIVQIDRLPVDACIPHYLAVTKLLSDRVRAMSIPDEPRPPRHSVMTVIARHGLTVFGDNESQWLLGWRYSNHLCNTFNSDLILVTEHGWHDFSTDWGGHHPRIA